MDGEQVKAWEALCVEEQPPACVAACPLHVDFRGMAEKIAAGDFVGAFALYARVVPLPAILAHVCDHPCETACRRAEAGGALRIAALERACVEEAYAVLKRAPQRLRRPKSVAIVGVGLAGLTAAHDLAMKGHAVTVFEADATALERLRHFDPAILPPSAIEADLGGLVSLGVEIRCRSRIVGGDGPLGLDRLAENHDAVLLAPGRGRTPAFAPTVALGPDGRVVAAAGSGATSHPKIFAAHVRMSEADPVGGDFADYSPIGSAHDGRRAANTIDRFLQGASLTAARGDEGGHASCLYVEVSAHPPVAPIDPADPAHGYDHAEAIAEAARCFPCRCRECVKACEYLARHGGYPKRYVREIWNNDGIVMGNRKANRMIDGCTLCGLCAEICPNDLSMGEVCLDARRSMVRRGKMPASHHDFALREFAFYRSAEATLARNEPGFAASEVVFFPGCQLAGSDPDAVVAIWSHLRARISGGVGLLLDCCGAPAHWAGRVDLVEEARAAFETEWRRMGRPAVVTACASCLKMLRELHPDVPAESLWTRLAAIGLPEAPPVVSPPLSIHDPCTARHDHATQAAVRAIAAARGLEVRELDGADRTTCCGYGGLSVYADPETADRIVERRIGQSEDDYLAWCAMCRDTFARHGKRTAHLLDFVFPKSDGDDPAGRPDPGLSARRDARLRLKARLLREAWGETVSDDEPIMAIQVPEDVRLDMERKLILVEDVTRTIAEAEASGRRLKDPASGRLIAAHRAGEVTYWVAYEPEGDGFVLRRAWSHRMRVEAKP
ncbi:MAG: 4Fe-4S dicluster domain-containing protein [Hyphomicrobiales bacterium]|nr:4Fe-4S dicluster domain-containing protein [Hyphomicrobiales bacterium]